MMYSVLGVLQITYEHGETRFLEHFHGLSLFVLIFGIALLFCVFYILLRYLSNCGLPHFNRSRKDAQAGHVTESAEGLDSVKE